MKLNLNFFLRCLTMFLLVGGLSSTALAQRTISGTVTDADSGDPLIGANVLVVGTSVGTVTDIDGKYSLNAPSDAKQVEISYTGYATQTVEMGASNVMDFTLAVGELLDEVVVVGYGSVKKSDLTGSVVSVGEDDFNRGLVTSPDQLIQGRAAGVLVTNNSGQPGGAATFRIRGNSSIRAGSQPLFVVDGVQLTGASTKPGTNTGDLGNSPSSNPLNYLNPADIASIQVLKDASATAIYGSRGANGVVIITTKKGRSGDPKVELSTSVGFSSLLNEYDILSGDEYRAALNTYGATGGDYGDDVNMMDEILQTATVQNHNISISGGTDAGSYRASFGYFDQEGIVKNNDLRRVTGNISGSYKLLDSKRLGLDFNLIASQTKENGPAVSTNAGFRGSLIGNALQWNPTHRIYDDNGDPIIIPDFGNFTNPVALLDAYRDVTNTVDLIASISPSFKLTDNLTYKFDYSIAHGAGERRASLSSAINLQDIEGRGLGAMNSKRVTNQVLTHSLNLNQEITSGIDLNMVVGYEYQKKQEKEVGFAARDFVVSNSEIDYTNAFSNNPSSSSNAFSSAPPDTELQSYFARANFNIQDKYLVTATVRADGSSKFGENNRYGFFPAFGVAWNLHNEDFLPDGIFDNLKLRVNYGQTGNSEFDAGASQERWGFVEGGIQQENVANPDLTWETSTTYGVGLDFSILDYKLTGTIDWYNKTSKDLLFQFQAIPPAPATLYWINLDGEVENKGLELSLNANIVDKGKLTWDLGANFSFVSNEVKNYNGPLLEYGQLFGQGISNANSMRLESGQPLNAFYLAEFDRIGEDGQTVLLNDGAKAYVGDPNPDMIMGVSTNVGFGDFALSLNFNGAFGHQIYNNTKNSVIPIGNLGTRNIDATLLDSPNQEAVSNPIAPSSRYIEDADYIKLANATLSYNIGNIGNTIKNVRLYLTGSNLLVFTDYKGFDPEVNTVNERNGLPSYGIEYIPYPSARTFILGANFGF